MYDIVGKKRWYFLFSALITIPGLIFVLLGGLKPTIDFTGGTTWDVEYASHPAPSASVAAATASPSATAKATATPTPRPSASAAVSASSSPPNVVPGTPF